MLGKNIGTKVDAHFMNSQYKAYLAQNKKGKKNVEPVPAKAPTKKGPAHKRAEMRKKGIFVQADSNEFDYSIMEKPRTEMRPLKVKVHNKRMKWKHNLKKILHMKTKRNKGQQGEVKGSQTQPHAKNEKVAETKLAVSADVEKIPRKEEEVAATSSPIVSERVILTHNVDEGQATAGTDTPANNSLMKLTTCREEIFAPLEEDVDLMKVLVDFNASNLVGVGADDRRSLEAAQKILKVAYREKAFEQTLTKEENEVLAKFFSGKIPYDGNVLHTLDGVLDKTIDYFRTHRTNLDPETKELIEKRETLKAAMLQTMLSMPKFLPSGWVKQYEAYREEAMKETSGINWARISLFYPQHRAFDDGAADIFGNFTRARRGHWLWGVIFGPRDSKTFEEVAKETQSQGFYLDTCIIEDAKNGVVTSEHTRSAEKGTVATSR
ncbi:hypothetical protein Aduo_000152 [Ancylostoma duodenale]